MGFGRTTAELNEEKAKKALSEFLRPEFINRVDEIICFNQLSQENFCAIANIMLTELATALFERGIALEWQPDLLEYLAKKSYSAVYGARNLRRTIQKELEDPMAEAIMDSYTNPISTIVLSIVEDKVELTTK